MKQYLVIILFFISLNSFADAGNAYRFNLELISKKGDTLYGYFYHYTYDKYDKYNDDGFKKFIKKDSISIYSFITTMSIETQTIDFTTKKFKKEVSINDFERIRVTEYLNFIIGEKLIELNQVEFDLIQTYPPKYELIYNEKVAENCNYILMSWKHKLDLSEYKKEISKNINALSISLTKNYDTLNDYISFKKIELLKNKVLLINHCRAL